MDWGGRAPWPGRRISCPGRRESREDGGSMPDALSEVLRAVRLTGGVFLDAEFSAPWCVGASIGPEDCRAFGIPSERVIATHYVLEGTVRLGLDGEPPVELGAGDLVLLPRNEPHRLASDLSLAPV